MATITTNKQHAEDLSSAEDAALQEMAAQAREEEPSPKPMPESGSFDDPGVNENADEWASLDDEFTGAKAEDPHAEIVEEVVEPAPEPVPVEEPEPEPVLTPAAEAPQEEVPTPEVEKLQEEVEIPQKPVETRPQEEVEAAMKEARAKAKEELTKAFQLTEEQEERWLQEPNKVLPELVAEVYLDLYNSMMQGMGSMLPQMVAGVLQRQEAETQSKRMFYRAWPQLAKPEYVDTIERITTAYRQSNPGADAETAVREIGVQAWVALKKPLDELVAITQGGARTEPPPPATPIRQPASPGNVPAVARAPAPAPKNAFEEFAEEIFQEDMM